MTVPDPPAVPVSLYSDVSQVVYAGLSDSDSKKKKKHCIPAQIKCRDYHTPNFPLGNVC